MRRHPNKRHLLVLNFHYVFKVAIFFCLFDCLTVIAEVKVSGPRPLDKNPTCIDHVRLDQSGRLNDVLWTRRISAAKVPNLVHISVVEADHWNGVVFLKHSWGNQLRIVVHVELHANHANIPTPSVLDRHPVVRKSRLWFIVEEVLDIALDIKLVFIAGRKHSGEYLLFLVSGWRVFGFEFLCWVNTLVVSICVKNHYSLRIHGFVWPNAAWKGLIPKLGKSPDSLEFRLVDSVIEVTIGRLSKDYLTRSKLVLFDDRICRIFERKRVFTGHLVKVLQTVSRFDESLFSDVERSRHTLRGINEPWL